MKTITAKEFQQQHATILQQVAKGDSYEVTFHRKPIVRLVPVTAKPTKQLVPGSQAAFLEALQHTAQLNTQTSGDVYSLPYKELRQRMITKKYGRS